METLTALLNLGASIEGPGALRTAVINGCDAVVSLLLQHKADPNVTPPLLSLCRRASTVSLLLAGGAVANPMAVELDPPFLTFLENDDVRSHARHPEIVPYHSARIHCGLRLAAQDAIIKVMLDAGATLPPHLVIACTHPCRTRLHRQHARECSLIRTTGATCWQSSVSGRWPWSIDSLRQSRSFAIRTFWCRPRRARLPEWPEVDELHSRQTCALWSILSSKSERSNGPQVCRLLLSRGARASTPTQVPGWPTCSRGMTRQGAQWTTGSVSIFDLLFARPLAKPIFLDAVVGMLIEHKADVNKAGAAATIRPELPCARAALRGTGRGSRLEQERGAELHDPAAAPGQGEPRRLAKLCAVAAPGGPPRRRGCHGGVDIGPMRHRSQGYGLIRACRTFARV